MELPLSVRQEIHHRITIESWTFIINSEVRDSIREDLGGANVRPPDPCIEVPPCRKISIILHPLLFDNSTAASISS